ncbi:MAG: efflux RND transporter periplasmic adaptor subunit [candidate division KSB1 bacterium]|jgi:Cu(I)/Ag(I) efflux system membrane fusion protein|nr:efflux RND transporter periplasmic adaptor subunit [candidate division KSB1 bacterium]
MNKMEEFLKSMKNRYAENRKTTIIYLITIILAFTLGFLINTGDSSDKHDHDTGTDHVVEQVHYTCSMHPQIIQPKKGRCPICGMDLVKVSSHSLQKSHSKISLSDRSIKLAEIRISVVKRKFISHKIRMSGRIVVDETRVRYITARVSGRIDRLYVNFTGQAITQGQHLADLYSPEVLSTHAEMIHSLKNVISTKDNTVERRAAEEQLNVIRERLRLWGLRADQIADMEKSDLPSDHISLYAPVGGVVLEKNVHEGMYVNEGSRIFTIADLSYVWLQVDAYESEIRWLRLGQEVEFHTEAYPGEIFNGSISFIEPVIDPHTRTLKMRVNVNNEDGRLKPEMLTHAFIHAEMPEGGEPPLVIPASAPLITGKRAVVYVESKGKSNEFEGREILLGPRVGDYYIVKQGLREGETVVTEGNFKIDSAMQIQAKSSMMNPGDGAVSSQKNHQHGEMNHLSGSTVDAIEPATAIPRQFLRELDDVYQVYFDIHHNLSHDQYEVAKVNTGKLVSALSEIDTNLLHGASHMKWMKLSGNLDGAAENIAKADDMEEARGAFENLSVHMIETAKLFGSQRHQLLVYHCPMAFDHRGADWLQNIEGTENPYFGSAMFSCGDMKEKLTSRTESNEEMESAHEH